MSVRHLHEQITRFTVDYPDLSSLDSVDDVVKSLELQRELDHQHHFFEAPHELPEQKPAIHEPAVQEDQKPAIHEEPGINEEQIPGIKEEPDITKDNVQCGDILLPAVKKSHCSYQT
ncbi:unnamed protein product [Calypogeia fissa]